jgi:hypothetical protein
MLHKDFFGTNIKNKVVLFTNDCKYFILRLYV